MAKVGCFGPAPSRLLSELRRRIDSSANDDIAQPQVWRCNPTAAYHRACGRRETRMAVSGGRDRYEYSSCTIHDLLDLDDNYESTASGDLSMAFYEASAVPLGMYLQDDDEDSPAACRFTAFDNIASTAQLGSGNSEQLPRENCLAKRATFPKVDFGLESITSPAKKFCDKLQNMKDWLLPSLAL